ncbi:MAG: hypothetical protein ACXVZJ_14605, partial [Terriglobales bacterium]
MTPRSLAAAALLFAVLLMASGCSTNPSFSSITQFGFLNPIAVPNSSTTTPFTSFDITFVDQGSQRMIVSSRSTKQVALFDASKDTALGATAAVFAGVGVDNPHSGPNGAVIVGNQIWAGDAASIVRVFDMST